VGQLTAQGIKKLGSGRHLDTEGLSFLVRGKHPIWVYRFQLRGKRRDMQLGKYPAMSLKEARIARFAAAQLRDQGTDPIEARKSANYRPANADRCFERIIRDTFDAHKASLKGDGVAGGWMQPLEKHVIPVIGTVDVFDVDRDMLLKILQPMWTTTPIVAEKIYHRLALVMKSAHSGYPDEIDSTIMTRLKTKLGKQGHTVTHIPAMPWRDVRRFYATLGETPTELTLRLLILTACRSGSVRQAHVDHFDGDTWNIPPELMKNSKQFRIALSGEAQRVVELARPLAVDGYLFSVRSRKPLSPIAMQRYMERRGLKARPHGFRSSFYGWGTETLQNYILMEKALAHVIGNKTQQAYDRSDALDARRPLMEAWASVVSGA
jgi:integrase